MLRLVIYRADAYRLVFPVAQRIAELCIRHGGDDGIGVGIAVSGNIYLIHLLLTSPHGAAVSCKLHYDYIEIPL